MHGKVAIQIQEEDTALMYACWMGRSPNPAVLGKTVSRVVKRLQENIARGPTDSVPQPEQILSVAVPTLRNLRYTDSEEEPLDRFCTEEDVEGLVRDWQSQSKCEHLYVIKVNGRCVTIRYSNVYRAEFVDLETNTYVDADFDIYQFDEFVKCDGWNHEYRKGHNCVHNKLEDELNLNPNKKRKH